MKLGELVFMTFCSIGAFNALFLSVYIWFQRVKNTIPSLLLSLFLVFTAFRIIRLLLTDFQDTSDSDFNFPLVYYAITVSALIGPMMYLYLKFTSIRNLKFRVIDFFHFLPFFIISLGQYYLAYNSKYNFPVYLGKHLVVLLQFLIYILISLRLYKKLRIQLRDGENPKELLNIKIIRQVIIIFSILWIFDITDIILIISSVQVYSFSYLNIFYSHSPEPFFYSTLTYFMLYVELKSGKITKLGFYTSKYGKSALPAEEALKLKEMISVTMVGKKVYKDPRLTLNVLAKQMKLTPHVLSQIINDQFDCNYNDFVNSYRIEEAKRMLSEKGMNNITVASIAYECGFNTLSAFNTAFKKFTSLTPSQFRNKQI